MGKEIDMGSVERKTFADSQQDGLLEPVMGVCMIVISARLFGLMRFAAFLLAHPRPLEETQNDLVS